MAWWGPPRLAPPGIAGGDPASVMRSESTSCALLVRRSRAADHLETVRGPEFSPFDHHGDLRSACLARITGGEAGLIDSHLCDALVERGAGLGSSTTSPMGASRTSLGHPPPRVVNSDGGVVAVKPSVR